jgi:hypothetical protein
MDHSALHAEVEQRIARLLRELRPQLNHDEEAEVVEFLAVREYGLALETLSAVLIDEKKRLDTRVVQEIDGIARLMGLRDQVFMQVLHTSYYRQTI